MKRITNCIVTCGFLMISAPIVKASTSELATSSTRLGHSLQSQTLATEGIYRFRNDSEVQPLSESIGGVIDDSEGLEVLGLNKDEPVAVQFNHDNTVTLSLLLVPQEQGVIPEKIVISKDEFERLNTEQISYGGLDEFYSQFSPYEDTEIAARRGFNRKGRLHSRGARGCVAYVKNHLKWNGKLGHGRDVTATLKRTGKWKTVSCKNAPNGAIASWTGGSHGLGHTAVRKGKGWCYDLNCRDPGKKYRMRECVVRK